MKSKLSLVALSIFSISFIYLLGCGGSSSGGKYKSSEKDVQYSINGSEITSNADQVFDISSSDRDKKDMHWHCGNYKNARRSAVVLHFYLLKREGSILDSI